MVLGGVVHLYTVHTETDGLYQFLKMLQYMPIQGILYEEFRGTAHPTMFKELAVILRSLFPNPLYTLLVHVHEV